MPPNLLTDLPADALGHVLYRLPTAFQIGGAASVNHAFCDASRLALKARPYSGEVVTLAGTPIGCAAWRRRPTAASSPARDDTTVKVWLNGACERTIEAHTDDVRGVAVLPGGARFVSVSMDCTAKLWTFDGALERTFEVGSPCTFVAALPDGVHFVVGTV